MTADPGGGRIVPASVMQGFSEMVSEGIMRGLRFQVASGWVKHYRPQTAWEVVMQKMEFARSEDKDTPEGYFFQERFGAQCEERW